MFEDIVVDATEVDVENSIEVEVVVVVFVVISAVVWVIVVATVVLLLIEEVVFFAVVVGFCVEESVDTVDEIVLFDMFHNISSVVEF